MVRDTSPGPGPLPGCHCTGNTGLPILPARARHCPPHVALHIPAIAAWVTSETEAMQIIRHRVAYFSIASPLYYSTTYCSHFTPLLLIALILLISKLFPQNSTACTQIKFSNLKSYESKNNKRYLLHIRRSKYFPVLDSCILSFVHNF